MYTTRALNISSIIRAHVYNTRVTQQQQSCMLNLRFENGRRRRGEKLAGSWRAGDDLRRGGLPVGREGVGGATPGGEQEASWS